MLNPKTVDAKLISTLLGAGLGASALEGDGDLVGGTIGLGIGAFAGSQIKVDLPRFDKIVQKNQILALPNKPVSELEKLKTDLQEKVKKSSEGFEFLSNGDIEYDKTDPFRTLTNKNIKSVIDETVNLSELKTLSNILKHENNLEKVDSKVMTETFRPLDDITRSTQKSSVENKISILSRYFQDKGYHGEELQNKLDVFSGNINENSSLVINRNTNTVSIGSNDFKVSSNFAGEGGVSSHVDNDNYSAVRKLNPFASMYLKTEGKLEGRAVAQALGINFADAAKEEAIARQIEKFAQKGAKPEDLKALLMQSPEFTQSDVDKIISKSYQHMERESGMRVMGASQLDVEGRSSDLARNISAQTSTHTVFNTDAKGVIKSGNPFRGFSATARNSGGSEVHRFESMVASHLNISNPKENVKAGHAHIMNLTGGTNDGLNALAPGERSQSTTGSRENPIYVDKKAKNKVVQAMANLQNKGMIPREYSTSAAVSRITTNMDNFNLVAKYLDPHMTSSLSDGASIARGSIRKEYSHESFKKYDIFSADVGDIALHSDIKDHVIARQDMGISFDAPELESKSYLKLVDDLRIIEESEAAIDFHNSQNSKNFIGPTPENFQRQAAIVKPDSENLKKTLRTSIAYNQDQARNEIGRALGGLESESGDAKALKGIITSMNLSPESGARALEEYRSVANKRFAGGTLLGVNPNGAEVRLSTEFDDHKLVKSFRSVDSNSDAKSSFVFKGVKDIGTDEVVKDFGVSGKVVVQNVSDSEFDVRYGVAQALNKTGYTPIETPEGLRFGINELDTLGNEKTISLDEFRKTIDSESLKAKSSGVGMITDVKDAGQKLSTEIYETLNSGGNLSQIESLPETLQTKLQSIANNIEPQVRSLGLDNEEDISKAIKGRNWALGQLATSLTEGKATSESVMGLAILGSKNISTLVDSIDADPTLNGKQSNYAVNVLSEMFGGDFVLDSLGDTDALRTNANNLYLDKVKDVWSKYSADNIGKSVVTNDILNAESQQVFNMAYLSQGESTHIASPDISTIMRLGSGSKEKSLSHSAQIHLKMNGGMTSEGLAPMGEQSAQHIYDLKFTSELARPMSRELTINSFLDTKGPKYRKDFLTQIGRMEPERIDQFLKSENVPEAIRNQDFLYYGLENKNSQNIVTVPIHKHATTRVGSHALDNGNNVFKALQGQVRDVISADQNTFNSGLSQSPMLDAAADKLGKTVKESFLSSNNPQMKGTLALEVPNSVYALSRQTANKSFDDVFEKYAAQGKSVVGFSKETAIDFLKGQGINANEKNLSKFIDSEGLLLTELQDGSKVRNILLENREPAQSANSVRPTYVKVLSDDYSTKDGKSFVYHSSQDKHYVELMYGDQDGDNTTLYGDKRKLSVEEYEAKALRVETMATNRNQLIALNEELKIKGKSSASPLYSMESLIQETDAKLPELGFAKESPEYFEHLATKQKERMLQGTIKGGAVKTVSPGVTQLAMGLAESAFQMQSYKGVPLSQLDRDIMSTLGHGLVENLLKMKHTDTSTFANATQLPVEALIAAREKYSIHDSKDTFENYKAMYDKQFEDFIPEDLREKYKPHVDRLFQADVENIKNVRENPSNTMHVAKNSDKIREGGVEVLSEFIEDVATSRNSTNISQMATEVVDTNIERSMKVGYNELLGNAKQNLLKNKFPLMLGAGGLAMGALITQKDPNFKPSQRARADTGSMMLAPNVVSQEQSKQSDPLTLQSLGRVATDYINPETSMQDIKHSVKQAVRIQGSYQHLEQDINQGMKEAIFGNNVSNVRIERQYD